MAGVRERARAHQFLLGSALLVALLIVVAEGVFPNLFTLWNLVPGAIAYALFRVAIFRNLRLHPRFSHGSGPTRPPLSPHCCQAVRALPSLRGARPIDPPPGGRDLHRWR